MRLCATAAWCWSRCTDTSRWHPGEKKGRRARRPPHDGRATRQQATGVRGSPGQRRTRPLYAHRVSQHARIRIKAAKCPLGPTAEGFWLLDAWPRPREHQAEPCVCVAVLAKRFLCAGPCGTCVHLGRSGEGGPVRCGESGEAAARICAGGVRRWEEGSWHALGAENGANRTASSCGTGTGVA